MRAQRKQRRGPLPSSLQTLVLSHFRWSRAMALDYCQRAFAHWRQSLEKRAPTTNASVVDATPATARVSGSILDCVRSSSSHSR